MFVNKINVEIGTKSKLKIENEIFLLAIVLQNVMVS